MVTWFCDICGKTTHVNPPTEQEFEEKEVSVDVPETVIDPKTKKKTIKITQAKQLLQVPKLAKMLRQDPFTLEVEEVDVPKQKDLFPRTVIVQLSAGQESIQKDFCVECFQKKLQPKFKKFWDELAKIKSK